MYSGCGVFVTWLVQPINKVTIVIISVIKIIVKLVVTTLPSGGKPAEGPVTIMTHSGGVGISTINFRFVKESVKPEISHNRIPSLSSPFTSRKKIQGNHNVFYPNYFF